MGAEWQQHRRQVGQPGGERLTLRARVNRFTLRAKILTAVVAIAALAGGCSSVAGPSAASHTTSTSGPLIAPKTSYAQDTEYFQDLAKVDPALSSYVQSSQGVALQALLTDGAAFCAFLKRGGGVDDAMESLVIGAKSVESKTHLPSSVATFNAIDAVSLVDLCSAELKLLPSADQAHIDSLSRLLSKPSSTG
jgi:hypothetical protein